MNAIAHISKRVRDYINKGQLRSVKAKKNILFSFVVKGGSILISFLLVPLTIDYVDAEQYGIWLTLSSVISWFKFFDIGLDKGLRNNFAKALAEGKKDEARAYVSSTYAILAGISSALLILFFSINPLLNWADIFNVDAKLALNLGLVMLVVFSFFCMNFVLKIITTIYTADQRPAFAGFVNFLTSVISLIVIFLLTRFTEGSLLMLALALGGAPILVLSILTGFAFRGDYKDYRPSIKYIDKKQFSGLASLGYQFFVIKIISVVIFSTDNMIITRLYGPAAVTPYALSFKYFGIITKVLMIITVPFWSAYTEAYTKNDIKWIKRTNKKLVSIWRLVLLGSVVLLVISPFAYKLWVPSVEIPFFLSACMFFYVNYLAWGRIFVVFVNGVSKVKLQMWTSIIGGVINIPLSIFLAKTVGLGTAGVIIASIVSLSYGPLIAPIQYKKILNGTAKGIWNK
ncbi:MAG: oligosaccharide flippase family protein [Bacteroidota bacterium]